MILITFPQLCKAPFFQLSNTESLRSHLLMGIFFLRLLREDRRSTMSRIRSDFSWKNSRTPTSVITSITAPATSGNLTAVPLLICNNNIQCPRPLLTIQRQVVLPCCCHSHHYRMHTSKRALVTGCARLARRVCLRQKRKRSWSC